MVFTMCLGWALGGLQEPVKALHEVACDTRLSDEPVLYHYSPMVRTLCLGRAPGGDEALELDLVGGGVGGLGLEAGEAFGRLICNS